MCIHLQLENYFGIKNKTIDDLSLYYDVDKSCKQSMN